MSTPPHSTARRNLVEGLVHTWRGRLSPQTQRALSTYDVDALEALVFGAVEVILASRGSIPGLTHAMDEGFASMRQDLNAVILEGLRDLAKRVPPDEDLPLYEIDHEQVDPSVVAGLLYRAVDHIEEQRIRIADMESQREDPTP